MRTMTAMTIGLMLIAAFPTESLRAENSPARIGEVVPELRFKDIRYAAHSLRDFREKRAIVLVSTNTTCPLVQKYWPKLNRLYDEYRVEVPLIPWRGQKFVRISIQGYNDIADIEALLTGLRAILK